MRNSIGREITYRTDELNAEELSLIRECEVIDPEWPNDVYKHYVLSLEDIIIRFGNLGWRLAAADLNLSIWNIKYLIFQKRVREEDV